MTDARSTSIAWLGGAAATFAAAALGTGAADGSARVHAAEAVWLGAHALLLVGLAGLRGLGLHRDGRLGPAGFALALAGRLAFAAADGIALVTGELPEALMPIAVMLTVAGMVLAGAAIAGARPPGWDGWRRCAPLAVGVYPLVAMMPLAAATGEPPAAAVALWAVPLGAVGLAARHATGALPPPAPGQGRPGSRSTLA